MLRLRRLCGAAHSGMSMLRRISRTLIEVGETGCCQIEAILLQQLCMSHTSTSYGGEQYHEGLQLLHGQASVRQFPSLLASPYIGKPAFATTLTGYQQL